MSIKRRDKKEVVEFEDLNKEAKEIQDPEKAAEKIKMWL